MSYQSEVLADSPVRYYRLAEASGQTADDIGSSNINGTFTPNSGGEWTGGTLGQTGPIDSDPSDKAPSFNGTTGYVSLGTGADLDFANSYTLECWVKLTAADAANYQTLISRWGNTSSTKQYVLAFGPTGSFDGLMAIHNTAAQDTKTCLSAAAESTFVGVWTHVAQVYDHVADELSVWINGVQSGSATTSVAGGLTGGGLDAQIGKHTDGLIFEGGLIDEVAIYGTALSGARLLAHYNAAASAFPTLSSAVVSTAGNSIVLTFSESVTATISTGFVLTPDPGGAATMTYASGSPGTALTYTLSRTLDEAETATLAYTQPGDGIEATTGGADVESFSGTSVTNNAINAPDTCAAVAVAADSIDVTWNNNATGHNGYKLQYDTVNTFDADPQTLTIAAGTESTQVVTLLANTTYYFRVSAYDGNGQSQWSNTASATTLGLIAPAITSTGHTATRITVLISDEATGGTPEYVYYACWSTGGGSETLHAIDVGIPYDIQDLDPETAYDIRSKVVDGVSAEDFSDTIQVTTQPAIPVFTPVASIGPPLRIIRRNRRFLVNWDQQRKRI